MAKVRLQGAGVMAGIGKGEAACMAQHVRVRLEREPGRTPGPLDQLAAGARAAAGRSPGASRN
jgi:hypothetical protein